MPVTGVVAPAATETVTLAGVVYPDTAPNDTVCDPAATNLLTGATPQDTLSTKTSPFTGVVVTERVPGGGVLIVVVKLYVTEGLLPPAQSS